MISSADDFFCGWFLLRMSSFADDFAADDFSWWNQKSGVVGGWALWEMLGFVNKCWHYSSLGERLGQAGLCDMEGRRITRLMNCALM